MSSCREHRPLVLIPEEAVGGSLHVHQILRVCRDATEDTERELDEQGAANQSALEKVGQVVEVPDVVAFEFELCAMRRSHIFQQPLDVCEGVAEDPMATGFEVVRFPAVLPRRIPGCQAEDPEVH
ncbi:hypothetical protein D3C71_1631910 [compost metagenome]